MWHSYRMPMETELVEIADAYAREAVGRAKSLSRVATIVVNRGSFFTSLKRGQTCSVRNFERMLQFFEQKTNWPDHFIPSDAQQLLKSLGRNASLYDVAVSQTTYADQ